MDRVPDECSASDEMVSAYEVAFILLANLPLLEWSDNESFYTAGESYSISGLFTSKFQIS